MLTTTFVITALAITIVMGAGLSAWLWFARQRQWVVTGGLQALAAMRWREFSRFVIEALQAQGFEASRIEPEAGRGQQADLLLNRDNQVWLLSCKQGVDYRIDVGMVSRLAGAVRDSSAKGGIIATLGRVLPEARQHSQGIELIDGHSLWSLIDPLLPPSLHNDLVAKARNRTLRGIALSWALAAMAGLAAAFVATPIIQSSLPVDEAPLAHAAPAPAPAAPESFSRPSPLSADVPMSEAEQRKLVSDGVANVDGVIRTGWITQSTLLVWLPGVAEQSQTDAICAVLERYDDLRSSRIQLQPPEGSGIPVRFLQCATF